MTHETAIPAPPRSAPPTSDPFIVHGLRVSYFTRKVTGYLDHAGLAWGLQPSLGANMAAMEAGWNGGIPVVEAPDGTLMWDSTSVILHLDTRFPERSVRPSDPVLAFLDALLDDFSDEWFYRHAVGSRWLFEENRVSGSLDIAREGRYELGTPFDLTREFVTGAMTACLPRLGTTPDNIDAWIADSLQPWQRVFGAHVAEHGFLLGRRPSLADFAFFGGNAAHFTNDPVCIRWTEESSMAVFDHTRSLLIPGSQPLGEWFAGSGDRLITVDDLPATLIEVLAEAGRHYLPWVASATVDGAATVQFESGPTAQIATTDFLDTARGVLLARYVASRCPELDGVLERAGILQWFADFTDQAAEVPDHLLAPQPADNRPYPGGA